LTSHTLLEVPSAAELSACDLCSLAGTSRPVCAEYSDKTEILLVGEAPGATEARKGHPFIGDTGQLLRLWLHRVGALPVCGFTNILRHRPPGNRDPEPGEIAACWPFLEREIQRINPKVIVAVGRFSAKAFGFKGNITSNTGKWIAAQVGEWSGPVMAMWHPSYVYRLRGEAEHRVKEHMSLAVLDDAFKRLTDSGELPEYPHKTTSNTMLWGIDVAIDTETTSKDPRKAELLLVGAYAGGTEAWVTAQPQRVGELATPIMHNAPYDLVVLARAGERLPKKAYCTMVLAQMLGEPLVGLKRLARKHYGVRTVDFGEANGVGWPYYVSQDCTLTYKEFERGYPMLTAGEKWVYDNIEAPLQPILARATMRGFAVDNERAKVALDRAEQQAEALLKEVQHIAGEDFNPKSPKQKSDYLYGTLGLPKPRRGKTKTGWTTSKTYIRRFSKQHPVINYMLGYSRVTKRISTYLRPLSTKKFVSTLYRMVDTARLSSSDPNLQNLPAAVKGFLRARDGHVLVSGDYSQIEMVIMAYLCQDETMLAMIRDGISLHAELTKQVYGVKDPKAVPELYVKCKSANFETSFGGGVGQLSAMLNIPMGEAQRIRNGQMRTWPRWFTWQDEQADRCAELGYSESLRGRRRVLHDLESSDPYLVGKARREATNITQTDAADMTKYAMVLADPWVSRMGCGCGCGLVLHQEHDSVILEVPEAQGEQAATLLEQTMIDAVPEELREALPIRVGTKLSTHWS
jgi:uracil-DNA glycosylase family 4